MDPFHLELLTKSIDKLRSAGFRLRAPSCEAEHSQGCMDVAQALGLLETLLWHERSTSNHCEECGGDLRPTGFGPLRCVECGAEAPR
jgi:hypothetical protein